MISLEVEVGVGIAGEPSAPEVDDGGLTVDAASDWGRECVLEERWRPAPCMNSTSGGQLLASAGF
jgi:hypothetical protein